MDYIAKLATAAPATSITGVLADGEKRLSDVGVTAESGGKLYRSVSDQTGWFNLSGPAPGKYKLRIFLPLNVSAAGPSDVLDKISGPPRRTVISDKFSMKAALYAVGCTPLLDSASP